LAGGRQRFGKIIARHPPTYGARPAHLRAGHPNDLRNRPDV